jgi:hypothetical protein
MHVASVIRNPAICGWAGQILCVRPNSRAQKLAAVAIAVAIKEIRRVLKAPSFPGMNTGSVPVLFRRIMAYLKGYPADFFL